jgi:hypothetical protein
MTAVTATRRVRPLLDDCPVSQAIFGLIGVIVGAALTGGWQWWLITRNRELRRRAAARLVLEELATGYSAIQAALNQDDTARTAAMLRDADAHGRIGASAWHAQRALLAEELGDRGWKDVSDAYLELDSLGELGDDEELVKTALELEGVYKARDALWPLAFPELEPTHDMKALRKQPEKRSGS